MKISLFNVERLFERISLPFFFQLTHLVPTESERRQVLLSQFGHYNLRASQIFKGALSKRSREPITGLKLLKLVKRVDKNIQSTYESLH